MPLSHRRRRHHTEHLEGAHGDLIVGEPRHADRRQLEVVPGRSRARPLPTPARPPCRWSAACRRCPRRGRSCDLRAAEPRRAAASTRLATSRPWCASTSSLVPHSGSAVTPIAYDARGGLEPELGDRGRQHLALTALHVVIVERDDRAAVADRLAQPARVDAIQPRQVDEAHAGARALLEFLRRVRTHWRAATVRSRRRPHRRRRATTQPLPDLDLRWSTG